MRPKMMDIANKAQVSVTAVSFALNGKSGISPETRSKVLTIAKEIGYEFKPNDASKTRKSSRGKTVLLLNCSRTYITQNNFHQTPYFSELLKAFESKLSAIGYHCWIKSIIIDEHFKDNLTKLFDAEDITGLILVATDMLEEDVLLVNQFANNMVVLDSCFDRIGVNCVVMDNYLGGVLAAQKAIQGGHKRIGYVQSSARIYNFEMRKRGFFEELERSDIKISPKDVLTTESTLDGSFNSLKNVLCYSSNSPTFFFAESDYIAIGLMKALQLNGIRVPEDVSVVGFDNIELTKVTTPQLTTVNVPKNKLAELCVSQIAHVLKNEKSVGIKHFISVDLVDRSSAK